ncbi:MAG: DUF3494 domain-containing protein [Bacteroidetes bacterium]|nr:DUF3494 domain-containing protein [Bacteroidota bacterium]
MLFSQTLSTNLQSFSILSGSSVTSVQTTDVNGNVGAVGTVDSTVKAGGTVTGSVCVLSTALDSLKQIQQAFFNKQAQTISQTNVSNTTYAAGTYSFPSSLTMSDQITLAGDSTSKFIFNVNGPLTFDAQLVLSGGVRAENIFFNSDSTVRILDSARICGTILCSGTISCMTDCFLKNARLLSADSVNMIAPADTLGIISKQLISFGSSCNCAIDLGNKDTCANNITMSDSVMWFKFVADSSVMQIIISSPINSKPKSLEVYSGTCNSLSLIGSNTVSANSDTLPHLKLWGLAAGSSYNIKVINVNPHAVFGLCVNKVSPVSPFASCGAWLPCGNNLVINGDFESGNTGFNSGQTFSAAGLHQGEYSIASAATLNALNNFWCATPYSGNNFMVCDGPCSQCATPSNNPLIWEQLVPICKNTQYVFSAWFHNLDRCVGNQLPPIQLTINSNPVVPTAITAIAECPGGNGNCASFNCAPCSTWVQICVQWTSGASTTVADLQINMPIANLDPFGNGDDIGIDDIEFNAAGNPAASFTFQKNEDCMGNTVAFTNKSTGAISFTWDFGDGTTSSAFNPTHVYIKPGQYVVSLTAATSSSGCGCCSEYSRLISVTPSVNGGYNNNCCSSTAPYASGGNHPGNPYSFDITGNTVAIGSSIYNPVRDTLTIKKGVTLTLQNLTLEFGPWGKIIVEPGGTLILDGCNLTGLSSCGTMWQGIEVWGDYYSNHTLSQQSAQGKLIMKTSGVQIRDAHNAITLGKFLDRFLPSACNQSPPHPCNVTGGPYNTCFSGGIITVNKGFFSNNANNIRFAPMQPGFANAGKIQSSTFLGGTLLDPGYKTGNISTNGYEYNNVNDPATYKANSNFAQSNTLGRTSRFAHLWNVRWTQTFNPITFADNLFFDAEIGIEIYNAKAFIVKASNNGNIFRNLNRAISAHYYNSSSVLYGNVITENTFSNASPFLLTVPNPINILIDAGQGDVIKNNTIGSPTSPNQSLNMYGVYLRNSSGFYVADNSFNRIYAGITSVNSAGGGGSIIYENNQVGNLFKQCFKGVVTAVNNPALVIKCNSHDNPNTAQGPYNRNWHNTSGTLAQQGFYSASDIMKPAGNEFNYLNTTGNPTLNHELQTATTYAYFSHGFPSKYIPINLSPPQPSFVNINCNSGCPSVSCPSQAQCCTDPCITYPPGCRIGVISTIDQQINLLQAEYNNEFANLDKGQTAQLISAINQNIPDGTLKNQLLNAGFLSDEALLALINRTQSTAPGIFKDVIIPNSPVSDNVLPTLNSKLQTLPSGIAKQIRNAQGSITYRTLTLIARDIAAQKTERQKQINMLLISYADSNRTQDAINLLAQENNLYSNQSLLATYIASGDISSAQAQFAGMVASNADEQAFLDLQSMLLNLAQQGKSVFEMDSAQVKLVRSIAAMGITLAASNAQAILRLVFGEDFSFAQDTAAISLRMQDETFSEKNEYVSDYYLSGNTPNPFSDYTVIYYQLPENTSDATITVYDITGKSLLKNYKVSEMKGSVKITTQDMQNGVYIYRLEQNGIILQSRKMVVIKQ